MGGNAPPPIPQNIIVMRLFAPSSPLFIPLFARCYARSLTATPLAIQYPSTRGSRPSQPTVLQSSTSYLPTRYNLIDTITI